MSKKNKKGWREIIVHRDGNVLRIEFDEVNQIAFAVPSPTGTSRHRIKKTNGGYKMEEIQNE